MRRRRIEAWRLDGKESIERLNEKRVEEMRGRMRAIARAKAGVEDEVMSQYKEVIRDYHSLERTYHGEVQRLHQGQAVEMEKELWNLAVESQDLLRYVKDHAQAAALKGERYQKEDWDMVMTVEGKEQMRQLLPPLEKLWSAMEVPRNEIEGFLREASSMQSYSSNVLSIYEEYAAKLEARKPILEVLTRREVLKKRFDATRRLASDPERRLLTLFMAP